MMTELESKMFKILMYFVSLAVTLIIFGEGYNISLNIDTHRALIAHEKEQIIKDSYITRRLFSDSVKLNEISIDNTRIKSCLIAIDPESYYIEFYQKQDVIFDKLQAIIPKNDHNVKPLNK